ncbi:unnamed protein product [Closterium sp. NIES-54]
MHSRLLVSSLPRTLPPLPPSLAPPCLPCDEGRQHPAPHSSFPPTTAPLQTLHMDVWGPAHVSGKGHERYFLVVVDDYTRGEFSFDLLRDFCRGEVILQSFTLPASPQQNGIAERRIGLVMEVALTSMIHAAAPHFLWPFAVRYAVHQLNLWPCVSLPETSPTLRWTGEVGDASVIWVWGSRAFVRDTSAVKLSARAIPSVFLGFPPDAPGWQFYHSTSRRVFPSQDVTLDKSVPIYHLFPYRSAPPQPPPLFLAPGPPSVDPLPPQGPAPSGVSQLDLTPGTALAEITIGSGAVRGAASGGAASGGAESGAVNSEGVGSWGAELEGEETGGAESEGVEHGGVESEGAESGGAEPQGAALSGGPPGASPRLSPRPKPLSPQKLREWLVRRARLQSGATEAGAAGTEGAGVAARAGGTGGTAAAGPGGARTRGTGAAGTSGVGGGGYGDPSKPGGSGAGGAGAGGAGAGGAGAGGNGTGGVGAGGAGVGGTGTGGAGARGAGAIDTVRPRPYFVPLLQQAVPHCYLCVPPDPGIEAAALGTGEAAALGASASAAPGAGESALSGTSSAQAFHTFTLDSGASRSFFRDRTTLTPLSRPVAVSLADPSRGPVLASFSTILPCPAAPSGTLSGLYLPSFSTNLVSGADLHDKGVDQFTPSGQWVTHCTCARTGRHLATFTRRPGSSLYTLTTASPPVAESGEVATSSQVFAAASRSGPKSALCSCRLLSHQTLLWHHRLGHPSLPRLRGMASRDLRAAPHSSEFPPTEAPLQTLHMDVWGPARVRGQGHERYFLLVVDDYSCYTTVFPLRSKGDVTEVLIDWIRVARLQLRERFGSDFPVLRLHSDRGGEISSARLGAFCRAHGIRQTFTLPASPQQNGIAERRIGMVMDVARTSTIHAAAPHFLWPFAVLYAAHQLNFQPRVSLPETSPTLRWTGKVGDASAFWVWGSRAFVCDLSADKLSPHAVPSVFLGFPPDAPGWQFYHPTSRRVLSSQDVTFDESVPYYRLFPYRTAPLPPPPLFLAPGPPPVDPLPPQGPAPSGVSQVDAVEPVEVAVDSGAAQGAESAGAGSGGAEPEGAEPGGAKSRGAEPGGAESGGAESGGAEPGGAKSGGAGSGGAEPGGAEPGGAGSIREASHGTSSRREFLSPQELREWFARRWSRAAGAGGTTVAVGSGGTRTGGTGAAGAGGAAWAAGVGPAGGTTGATGTIAAGATGAGAAGGVGAGGSAGAGTSEGAGVGAVGARGAAGAGAASEGTGAVPAGPGGATRLRPSCVPLPEQVLGLPPPSGPAPPLACPQPVPSQSQLQPASPLPAPSPYTGPTGGLAERREPTSHPASPVRAAHTSRCAPLPRHPAVPGTHPMALRPSTAPLRVPLPSPPESSLPILADSESDSFRAASPTVTRLLATVVTDPSFESIAASALVAELVDFAARCRLDYATRLVAESEPVCPPSVGGECALSMDVLEDRQEESQCFAASLPHLVSTMTAPEGDPDAQNIPPPRSYAEAIEGPYSS